MQEICSIYYSDITFSMWVVAGDRGWGGEVQQFFAPWL